MPSDVKKYRKKPVVIEAWHFKLGAEIPKSWNNGEWGIGLSGEIEEILIPTLEGNMKASVGDYIIKGIRGEFYPCKPDIFEASYEEADDAK